MISEAGSAPPQACGCAAVSEHVSNGPDMYLTVRREELTSGRNLEALNPQHSVFVGTFFPLENNWLVDDVFCQLTVCFEG